ncbi:MAG: T9SS type A sorting domain-containing protein [Flavobacteriales bacterium]|nr:T9SS type A sorting domain-containing protein [Flavobacteriales bacterium]
MPGSGSLSFDTDDLQLNDAAFAVYTTGGTTCPNLVLTRVATSCSSGGSLNGGNMPVTNVTGLTPGTTVYIRVWRDNAGANDGTFVICARNPQTPSGCWYTLRLTDSAGDGWNGGFVTLCINGSCTNYTVYGSLSTVVFTANVGDLVTLSYTAVGGFQNQVSWTLSASTGANIWPGPISNPPSSGPQHSMTVNAACNVPPAPISDCIGHQVVCNNQNISYNPSNTGNVVDLTSTNDGCLAGEQQGAWFVFTTNAAGNIAFTLNVAVGTDYDFAVWGPFAPGAPPCPPPGAPIRCNWSATTGPTGLSLSSFTPSVGAVGSPFSQWITAGANEMYILYVDNWSRNGISFSLTWQNTPTNILDCVLPVELVEFDAYGTGAVAQLKWTTASEENLSHFVIERSADGTRFDALNQVQAAGERSLVTRYETIDQSPMRGVNHYRLRMVDDDGSVQHSKVIPVRFGWSPASVQVFPNPAGSSLWVAAHDVDEGWQWRILDASGRMVRAGRAMAESAQFEIPLTIESGAYVLEVLDQNGATMGQARFVKD